MGLRQTGQLVLRCATHLRGQGGGGQGGEGRRRSTDYALGEGGRLGWAAGTLGERQGAHSALGKAECNTGMQQNPYSEMQ